MRPVDHVRVWWSAAAGLLAVLLVISIGYFWYQVPQSSQQFWKTQAMSAAWYSQGQSPALGKRAKERHRARLIPTTPTVGASLLESAHF